MAKSQQSLSEHQIARRIKEGRGQGVGKKYRPWLYVQEVPSEGRSHRIYSHKTDRIHHLLSDLELAVFLVLEWTHSIADIREQFPLRPRIGAVTITASVALRVSLAKFQRYCGMTIKSVT